MKRFIFAIIVILLFCLPSIVFADDDEIDGVYIDIYTDSGKNIGRNLHFEIFNFRDFDLANITYLFEYRSLLREEHYVWENFLIEPDKMEHRCLSDLIIIRSPIIRFTLTVMVDDIWMDERGIIIFNRIVII